MSSLGDNDAHLHYMDGSHRWTDPLGKLGDDAWRELVEAHLAKHRDRLSKENSRWPGHLQGRGRAADPHA